MTIQKKVTLTVGTDPDLFPKSFTTEVEILLRVLEAARMQFQSEGVTQDMPEVKLLNKLFEAVS